MVANRLWDITPVQVLFSVTIVSAVVYADYGEPSARIVHGRDQDFTDIRTHEHNRFIEARIEEAAGEAPAPAVDFGRRAEAAELLGISRKTLWEKIKNLDIAVDF